VTALFSSGRSNAPCLSGLVICAVLASSVALAVMGA